MLRRCYCFSLMLFMIYFSTNDIPVTSNLNNYCSPYDLTGYHQHNHSTMNQNYISLKHVREVMEIFKYNKCDIVLFNSATGTGKSTILVPEIVDRWIENNSKRKVILTLPRKTSCDAAYERIRTLNQHQSIRLAHGNRSEGPNDAPFIISTPAAAELLCSAEFLINRSIVCQNEYLFILDEFHDANPGYMKYFLDTLLTHNRSGGKVRILLLSATLDIQAIEEYLSRFERLSCREMKLKFNPPYRKEVYCAAELLIACSTTRTRFEERLCAFEFTGENAEELTYLRDKWARCLNANRTKSFEQKLRIGAAEKFSMIYDAAVTNGMIPISEKELLSFWGSNKMKKTDIMLHIAREYMAVRRDPTGIILMVPGIKEIDEIAKSLEKDNMGYKIIKVHSELYPVCWERAPWIGIEKFLIVSTSVLEDCVTIPHLKVFVDFGMENQMEIDIATRAEKMVCNPITKSSALQRQGRIGRVCDGLYISLLTEDHSIVKYWDENDWRNISLRLLKAMGEDRRYMGFNNRNGLTHKLRAMLELFLNPPKLDFLPEKLIRSLETDILIRNEVMTSLGQWCGRMGCDILQAQMLHFGIIYEASHQAIKMAALTKSDDLDPKKEGSVPLAHFLRRTLQEEAKTFCNDTMNAPRVMFQHQSELMDNMEYLNMLMSLPGEERNLLMRAILMPKKKYAEFMNEYEFLRNTLKKTVSRLGIKADNRGRSFPCNQEHNRNAAHKVLLATGLLGVCRKSEGQVVHFLDCYGEHRTASMPSTVIASDEEHILVVSHCIRYDANGLLIWKQITILSPFELRYCNSNMVSSLFNWMDRNNFGRELLKYKQSELYLAQRATRLIAMYRHEDHKINPKGRFKYLSVIDQPWLEELEAAAWDIDLLHLSTYQSNNSFAGSRIVCKSCDAFGHVWQDCHTPSDVITNRRKAYLSRRGSYDYIWKSILYRFLDKAEEHMDEDYYEFAETI